MPIAAAGSPDSPEALTQRPLLSYWREAADDRWTLKREAETCEVLVNSRYHVDNPEVVLEACLQGLGIGLLPDYLCLPGLAEGRLQKVLPDWTPQTRFGNQITALIPPERLRLPRNRRLIDFLQGELIGNGPRPDAT